jgi:putative flippase GtrA
MPTVVHRFARFAVVGAIATATHAAVFTIAIEIFHIEPVTANALAFIIAMLTGYALNRRWTFGKNGTAHARLWRYAVAALLVLALNSAIMYAVVHIADWSAYVGLLLSILLAPPVSFALNQYWVFAHDRNGSPQ